MGKRAGRKLKLTPELAKKIVNGLRAGVTKQVAIAAAHVDQNTFYRWLRDGEKYSKMPESAELTANQHFLAQFYRDASTAMAEYESWLISQIDKSIAEGNTADAKWMLERRFPRRWMPRHQIGVSKDAADEDAGPAEITFVLKTPKKPIPPDSFGTEDEADSRKT